LINSRYEALRLLSLFWLDMIDIENEHIYKTSEGRMLPLLYFFAVTDGYGLARLILYLLTSLETIGNNVI